jgi:hypothetical protein
VTAKLVFGILSLIPAVIAYTLYFRSMFTGKTKPHAFSWLVWGILAVSGFFAQVSANGGFGAWVTGLTAVASLTIFCFALRMSATQPTRFDWTLLSIALAGLLLLLAVKNKDAALCLTLIALVAGFAMNIRKAYRKPNEENAMAFWLNTLKFVPAIFALSSFTFLTVAYPLVAAIGNAAVAVVVQMRSS